MARQTNNKFPALEATIESISGASKYKSKLLKLGILTVRDLIFHFPSRYDDLRLVVSTVQASDMLGERVVVEGVVSSIKNTFAFRRRMMITEAVVADDEGSLRAVWFNQPYLEKSMVPGTHVRLAGKIAITKRGVFMTNPVHEKYYPGQVGEPTHTGGFVPVYPETTGVSSRLLRFLIKPILAGVEIPDPLPTALLEQFNVIPLDVAIREIHFPSTDEQAKKARERIAFDEILAMQLRSLTERRKLVTLKSAAISFDQQFIKDRIKKLPFVLTKDQKVALWEIFKDFERRYPMNRLLEGDVGSGKTVVALLATLQVFQAGWQTAYLAPTEILAQQHFKTMTDLAGDAIKIALLTSSGARSMHGPLSKQALKKAVSNGEVDLLVGTHALLEEDVLLPKLALVVIDEQHRFGISQRATLLRPRGYSQLVPHLLSMTATPIPRTLALTVFGDLDISIIKEKPKNRRPIETSVVPPSLRQEAYEHMDREILAGRQIFVLCPRVQLTPESVPDGAKPRRQPRLDELDAVAVEEEFKRLSENVFPHRRLAKLHGRMKPKDKESTMREFKDGWYDILVTTSVIEVGVDVPNATVMAIENADRFGLAQLHQFRGRVGRAEHQSYCFLFTSSDEKAINKRLAALVECEDGFTLAEQDLKLRGPGEFLGTRQSGLPDIAMNSLADVEIIKKARLASRVILREDPSLKKYPMLRRQLSESRGLSHRE